MSALYCVMSYRPYVIVVEKLNQFPTLCKGHNNSGNHRKGRNSSVELEKPAKL